MSKIQTFLNNILSARYGRDVRQSIHDAIKEVDRVADTAQNSATQMAQIATEKAEQAAKDAEAVANSIENAEQYAAEAETSADNAKTSETNAKTSETNAKASETNAKVSEQNAQRVFESLPEDYSELSKAFYSTAIKNTATGKTIHVTDSADSKVIEFGLHGKAEQNGTPTPDAPVDIEVAGASGSVEGKSGGKNRLKNTATSMTTGGVIYIVNEKDKSILANGVATSSGSSIIIGEEELYGDYILSGAPAGTSFSGYKMYVEDADGNVLVRDYENNGLFTANGKVRVRTMTYSGVAINNLTFYPMIRLASDTDDTYEPYKETVATISTPDGLASVGGVYDEIIKYADGSGKRIQRIGKAVFDGSDDEGWFTNTTTETDKYRLATTLIKNLVKSPVSSTTAFNGISNVALITIASTGGTYGANNGLSCAIDGIIWVYSDSYNTSDVTLWTAHLAEKPMILYYELATPIITDLTAEEIAEIEKLHTFYPVTNISNDANCNMTVKYLADAKNYIDGRLALIESAMINNI